MSSGLDWQVFHPGQHAGPYGRVVPAGRIVLELAPADTPNSLHTVVEQSPEQLLAMLQQIEYEVQKDTHGRPASSRRGWV